MARRRRRIATKIKIKNSSLFAFILLNLLIASAAANLHHNQQHHNQQHHNHHHNNHHHYNHNHNQRQQHDTKHLDYTNKLNNKSSLSSQQQQQQQQQQSPSMAADLCKLLPSYVSKHLKLCKLIMHSEDADEAVTQGASSGLSECRNQFKWDRWNCTHAHGDHHLLTSELAQSIGNKESGFLHAIAAAGIVHSIATACSVGNLSDCACDKSRIGLIRKQEDNWKWGGCSNNIRHGMLFAKHLVELLDAVHQHTRNQDASSANLHRLAKRSLSSAHREPNQLRNPAQANSDASGQQQQVDSPGQAQVPLSYCQRNHNISQSAHFQLIKSLLSRNSLERHQEFRLAMNMHNNKVGRMAVAKNMVLRCRCHGLSGSCNLKTCWMTLPNFQVIGDYLKRKYEASIHLPEVVNVNRLIPMMDRNELSAILSGQTGATLIQAASPNLVTTPLESQQQQQHQQPSAGGLLLSASGNRSQVDQPTAADLDSAMLADAPSPARAKPNGYLIPTAPNGNLSSSSSSTTITTTLSTALNSHYNYYYERHKALQAGASSIDSPMTTSNRQQDVADIELHNLTNIAPFSQQQYQALLKDMKLCNNITTSYLTTRDLNQQQLLSQNQQDGQLSGRQQLHKKLSPHQQQTISTPFGAQSQHLIKSANQHLSQLLHSNKDDLIHLHKSPDYCEADLKHGYPGVKLRTCSDNPSAPDNCDKLCCGRGYTTHVYQHKYKCDCKFQYCCSIWCSECEKEITWQVCK